MSRSVFFPPAAGGGGGGITNINVSAGTTSNNLSNLTFADSPTVSFGLDGSTITGSAAGGGGLTNIRVSAGTTSNLLSAITFSNSNGLAFGLNASTLTGSYTVPVVTNSSWTASDTATSMTIARLAFTNSNGLTMTLSTAAGGSATLIGSHNGITTQTNQTLSWVATSNTTRDTTLTVDARSLTINGAGILSAGFSNGSIVLSVPAGGGGGDGGVFAGVSTGGNTAGSTGTVSTGDFVLVGSNQITLSQSTGAAGSAATVTFLAPGYISRWANTVLISSAGDAQGNSLVSVQQMIIPEALVFSNVEVAGFWSVATAANSSSAFQDVSISGVFYTRNVSTLSSVASYSTNYAATWNSNTTGSITGANLFSATLAQTTFTAGEYWLALHFSTTNSSTNGSTATTALAQTVNMILGNSVATVGALAHYPGSNTNATLAIPHGQGVYSTNATRASIGLSVVTGTGTRGRAAPFYYELRDLTWQ